LFRSLNALYWALAGGLGWGFGTAVGDLVGMQGASTFGGALGFALVLIGILTISPGNKQSEVTPLYLGSFGGAAAGSASLSLLNLFSPELNVALGGGVGFIVGLLTSVMKQYFAPLKVIPACAVALAGSALLTGLGSLDGGTIGWAAAGAVCLFSVAILAECLRREPAIEIDADEQPVVAIPRREMCRQVAVQSWSLSHPLSWGWHGLLGALLVSLWAFWAADQARPVVVRMSFLVCGGLGAAMIIAVRAGLLRRSSSSS
jgi:hypothetical protein